MKKYKTVIIVSLIITFLAMFSGAVNWVFQFTFMCLVYFLATVFLLRKLNDKKTKIISAFIIAIPFLLFYGYPLLDNIFRFGRFHVFPIGLTPIVMTFMGYLYVKKERDSKLLVLCSFILISIGCIGMPNWLNFTHDYENPINEPFPELALLDINNEKIELEQDKVIVLDLWSTSCNVCIKKFPDFEKLKIKYKNDDDVEFYTLNLPLKRDSVIDVKSYVSDYKFNSLFAKDLNSWKKLENRTVPKLLILSKNKRIVYKGSMNDKWYLFYNNINSLLEKYK